MSDPLLPVQKISDSVIPELLPEFINGNNIQLLANLKYFCTGFSVSGFNNKENKDSGRI
jgi:hypothetical protein